MQKLTITFVYDNDEERRLKYRVTDDMPVGVMIEKLIGFQFVIDSADPTTFEIMHNGTKIDDLTKTFEHYSVLDGDEIHLIPTVFEPIPPLPENDLPIKRPRQERKPQQRRHTADIAADTPKKEPMRKPNSYPNQKRRRPSSHSSGKPQQGFDRPASAEKAEQVKDAPVPFKPKNNKNNFYRSHKKPSGNKPQA